MKKILVFLLAGLLLVGCGSSDKPEVAGDEVSALYNKAVSELSEASNIGLKMEMKMAADGESVDLTLISMVESKDGAIQNMGVAIDSTDQSVVPTMEIYLKDGIGYINMSGQKFKNELSEEELQQITQQSTGDMSGIAGDVPELTGDKADITEKNGEYIIRFGQAEFDEFSESLNTLSGSLSGSVGANAEIKLKDFVVVMSKEGRIVRLVADTVVNVEGQEGSIIYNIEFLGYGPDYKVEYPDLSDYQ